MILNIAASLLIKPLAFAAASLPLVIDNLRTGNITNMNNAILLVAGLGVMALGPTLGLAGFQLPALSPWMLVALVPFVMFALKWVRGGAAKFLIALLPWFSPGEYLAVVVSGFVLAGVTGAALRRKDVQIATPMVLLGLIVLALGAAARWHA
jgi:Flp pilus assembly protein protease CpaA